MFKIDNQIQVIVKKDLKEQLHDRANLFGFFFLSLFISVILPSLVCIAAFKTDQNSVHGFDQIIQMISKISNIPQNITEYGAVIYVIYKYLLFSLILLLPVMFSNITAIYSFVGEKEKRTAESMLCTPISERSLVLGKILASFIPAMLLTFICVVMYSIIADIAVYHACGFLLFPTADWFLTYFLIAPAIVFLSITLVVAISQKVKSSKSAQSVSMILVFPIIGSLISQMSGSLVVTTPILLAMFAVIAIIDFTAFRIVYKKFDKENYLLNL